MNLNKYLNELTKQSSAKNMEKSYLEKLPAETLAKIAGVKLSEASCTKCGSAMVKSGEIYKCGCGMVKSAAKDEGSWKHTLALPPALAAGGAGVGALAGGASAMRKGMPVAKAMGHGAGYGAMVGGGAGAALAGLVALSKLLNKADPTGSTLNTAVQLAPAALAMGGAMADIGGHSSMQNKEAADLNPSNLYKGMKAVTPEGLGAAKGLVRAAKNIGSASIQASKNVAGKGISAAQELGPRVRRVYSDMVRPAKVPPRAMDTGVAKFGSKRKTAGLERLAPFVDDLAIAALKLRGHASEKPVEAKKVASVEAPDVELEARIKRITGEQPSSNLKMPSTPKAADVEVLKEASIALLKKKELVKSAGLGDLLSRFAQTAQRHPMATGSAIGAAGGAGIGAATADPGQRVRGALVGAVPGAITGAAMGGIMPPRFDNKNKLLALGHAQGELGILDLIRKQFDSARAAGQSLTPEVIEKAVNERLVASSMGLQNALRGIGLTEERIQALKGGV
jgi:hypothetical protein